MSYHRGQPLLGATFVPGGFDDFQMPSPSPEVVSPAPQRIMPEVPEQMQDSLSRLELEANEPQRHPSVASYHSSNHSHDYTHMSKDAGDLPNFSPFPKVPNRPANVPQSDDEREAMLENARLPVLNSNDAEMQLAWAQDALAYVDAALLHEQRISQSQPARAATPQVEHQLRIDAMNIVSFLADQHHPKAEFMRGMWLEFGKFGMRIDKKEAFRSYSRAADKGYARAQYRIGMQYEQSNDPAKALIHYNRGVEAGDSASNYRLGMMALMGQHGQPQDFTRGVQLLRHAADTADENAPQGAYVLGMLYSRELPQITVPEIYLPFDERAARTNIEKAAFLGFAKAQLNMGSAYELCSMGCEFNPALSMHYNALAARQGEAEADMAISKWFLCGYEGVFHKNEELAYTYAQRAALTGLPTAEFAMGYFNEIGMYVPVNIDRAVEWYEKAAKSGNKDASDRIEGISKSRTLSKKDHENVAINRIRSQYGSKRGARPERFKQPKTPLPTISDQPTSPTGYSPPSAVTSPGGMRAPSRGATTTPYPLEDKPPSFDPPVNRHSSTTPYPMEDGPLGHPSMSPRPSTATGLLSPDIRSSSAAPLDRPSSAFGISPHIYGGPGGGRGVPAGSRLSLQTGQGAYPARPYSTAADMAGGRRPAPNHRSSVGSTPSNFRQPMSPGVEQPKPEEPARLDIGFSAPDDKRGRLPKPASGAPPSGGKPPPQSSARPNYGAPNDRPITGRLPQERPSPSYAAPGSQTRPTGGRPPSATTPVSSAPPRKDAASKPLHTETKPPAKPSAPSGKPSGQPSGPAASAAKPAAGNRPGKGPKTFEEMGVPQGKKEGDCVVM